MNNNKKNKQARNKKETTHLYTNRKWLYDRYVTQNMSAKRISDMFGVSVSTVIRYIEVFNLEENPSNFPVVKIQNSDAKKVKKTKKTKKPKKWVEGTKYHSSRIATKYKSKSWLLSKWVDEWWTIPEMASFNGVSDGVIRYWLDKYGISRVDSERFAIRNERLPTRITDNTENGSATVLTAAKADGEVSVSTVSAKQISDMFTNILNPYAVKYAYSAVSSNGLWNLVKLYEDGKQEPLTLLHYIGLIQTNAVEHILALNEDLGLSKEEANNIIMSHQGAIQ